MRIARYTTGEDPAYGIVEGEPGREFIAQVQGDPLYQPLVLTGEQVVHHPPIARTERSPRSGRLQPAYQALEQFAFGPNLQWRRRQ